MFKVIIKPFAEIDILEAAQWYNSKKENLGDDFLLAVDAKINAIKRNPLAFQVIYKNFRRALTARFPYGIFFIVENHTIYILGVLHTFRNPSIWKSRK